MQLSGDSAREANPWPKHHQVYMVLMQQIREGYFPADKAMPNEMLLAEQFGVSRITIRKAMERLEREGAIDRARGRGTFVRPASIKSPVSASLSGSLENLIAMGLETDVRVVEFSYVAASAQVCAALEVADGVNVQKVIRVRSHKGVAFSYLTTFVPEDIGRTYDQDDLSAQPLLRLLERGGAKIARAEQVISATLAVPDVADLLGIEPGAALISIRRIVRDENERPVEYICGLYRPDTYEHQMSFDRDHAGAARFWKP